MTTTHDHTKCPSCGSANLRFVYWAQEYHEAVQDENGVIELENLDDSYPEDSMPEFWLCLDCDYEGDWDGTKKEWVQHPSGNAAFILSDIAPAQPEVTDELHTLLTEHAVQDVFDRFKHDTHWTIVVYDTSYEEPELSVLHFGHKKVAQAYWDGMTWVNDDEVNAWGPISPKR